MLPTNLKRFFWDVRYENLDKEINKRYIISRLLELGDEEAVKWVEQSYTPESLVDVIKNTHQLTPKSARYWKLRYDIA